MVLEVGDLMRISVALLKDMYDSPGHSSETVMVKEIRWDAETGTKIITVMSVRDTNKSKE